MKAPADQSNKYKKRVTKAEKETHNSVSVLWSDDMQAVG